MRTPSWANISSWVASITFVSVGTFLLSMWFGMFLHAVRAWRFLGRWPQYGQPDPKDLSENLQNEHVETAVSILVAIGLVWVSLILLRRVESPIKRTAVAFVLFVAGLGWWWVDPGGVLNWYMD